MQIKRENKTVFHMFSFARKCPEGKLCLAPGNWEVGVWFLGKACILAIFSLLMKTYTCKCYLESEKPLENHFLSLESAPF